MKIIRAILIGISIWIIGVLFYLTSFYVPIIDDLEQQSNIVLSIIVIPLVWYGCKVYYKSDNHFYGFKIGITFLLVSIIFDALFTVPFFMIPNGINHYDFFTTMEFWVIALEFLFTAIAYWYIKVSPHRNSIKQY